MNEESEPVTAKVALDYILSYLAAGYAVIAHDEDYDTKDALLGLVNISSLAIDIPMLREDLVDGE